MLAIGQMADLVMRLQPFQAEDLIFFARNIKRGSRFKTVIQHAAILFS
jgi:hypothetical protein